MLWRQQQQLCTQSVVHSLWLLLVPNVSQNSWPCSSKTWSMTDLSWMCFEGSTECHFQASHPLVDFLGALDKQGHAIRYQCNWCKLNHSHELQTNSAWCNQKIVQAGKQVHCVFHCHSHKACNIHVLGKNHKKSIVNFWCWQNFSSDGTKLDPNFASCSLSEIRHKWNKWAMLFLSLLHVTQPLFLQKEHHAKRVLTPKWRSPHMCVDGVFHSECGSMESSMSMQHSFHFVAKFSIFFQKCLREKIAILLFLTNKLKKISKNVLGKSFLCVKNIGGKTLSTHMCADRSLWQTVRNLIAFWGCCNRCNPHLSFVPSNVLLLLTCDLMWTLT